MKGKRGAGHPIRTKDPASLQGDPIILRDTQLSSKAIPAPFHLNNKIDCPDFDYFTLCEQNLFTHVTEGLSCTSNIFFYRSDDSCDNKKFPFPFITQSGTKTGIISSTSMPLNSTWNVIVKLDTYPI